jgi:iron complex outermembrane receptor protein
MNNSINFCWRKHKLLPLVAAISVSLSGAANAAILMEKIEVTAQKRVQNLQEVGVSVTAFNAEQLNALGWDNSMDVAAQTPGLVATSNTGDTSNIALFSIRGVNQGDYAEGQEAPIAIYNDEVYLSSPGASGAPSFDLARIEVLRGPQGTLYGRNATGGLVHFISNKPTEYFESSIDMTVAEYGQFSMTGVVSGSLSDTVQGRLAIYDNRDDGYVKNASGQDYRSDDTSSVRAMVNVDISDDSTLLMIGRFTDIDTRGGVYHNRATKSTANGPVFCQSGDTDCGAGIRYDANGVLEEFQGFFNGDKSALTTGSLFDPRNGQLDDGIGGVHEGAFDFDSGVDRESSSLTAIFNTGFSNGIHLTSVTDFTTSDKEYREDDDSSALNLVTYVATADVEQLSQELRIDGDTDTLRWTGGVYFLNIKNDFSGAFQFPSDGYLPTYLADSETNTVSVFGQIDVDLSETLLLTAGLRWTEDDKVLSYQLTGEGAAFADGSNFLYTGDVYDFDRTDSEFSGKLQLDWQASDEQLFYAGYNRGTKGGGFNTPSDGFTLASEVGFEPEILTSYEIGSKTSFADDHGRFNTSIFYYDYANYQGFFFSGTTSLLINSEASFIGGEAELTYATDNGWDFLFGLSVLDTEVNGVSNDGSTVIKNQKALLAPEMTANALIRKEWEMDGARVAAQISTNYVGKEYFNLINSEATAAGNYALTNLKVTYFSDDQNWEASAFVNNVFDKEAVTFGYDLSDFGNYSIYVVNPPRWAGVNFKYTWF